MRVCLLGVSAFCLCLMGCKNGEFPLELPFKDPRSMTWTADTIVYPGSFQNLIQDIYVANSSDVYIVGHCDVDIGNMWHFDGKSWTAVNLQLGGQAYGSLWSITGFGANDIYAAGDDLQNNALTFHFDGQTWTRTTLPGKTLFTIRGSSPSDIWTGGWMNSLFHFDGVQWQKIDVGDRLWFKDFRILSATTFALAYTVDQSPHDSTWYFFLAWNGKSWDTLNSHIDVTGIAANWPFGPSSLNIINGRLYSAGFGAYQYNGAGWQPIFDQGAYVFGSSMTGLFVVGSSVYYDDGQRWTEFRQFTSQDFSYWSGWTDGKEVFIVGNNFSQGIVIHGR